MMFTVIKRCICTAICLSAFGQLFAAQTTVQSPQTTAATTSTTNATTSTANLLASFAATKAQLTAGSAGQSASGASQANKGLLDDTVPMKLIQGLVDLEESAKRRNDALKEIQDSWAVVVQRVTDIKARLVQLNTQIPTLANAVQTLAPNTQKGSDWQTATTNMYVAVAERERLNILLQRYTGALKKLDAIKNKKSSDGNSPTGVLMSTDLASVAPSDTTVAAALADTGSSTTTSSTTTVSPVTSTTATTATPAATTTVDQSTVTAATTTAPAATTTADQSTPAVATTPASTTTASPASTVTTTSSGTVIYGSSAGTTTAAVGS
jgi:hypothetical protein